VQAIPADVKAQNFQNPKPQTLKQPTNNKIPMTGYCNRTRRDRKLETWEWGMTKELRSLPTIMHEDSEATTPVRETGTTPKIA